MAQSQIMLHNACPRCGSPLRYTGGKKKLECKNCGYNRVLGRNSDQVDHHPLRAGVKLDEFDRGLGGEFISYACGDCGSMFARAVGEEASHCPFCGSDEIEKEERDQEVITPSGIIPFTISQQQARAQLAYSFRNWFLADGLRKLTQPDEIQGVYIPYFQYDALTRSTWRVESGFKVIKLIKDSPVEQTAWEPTGGYYEHFFQNIVLPFTQGIDFLDQVEPFDFSKLVPFDPRYLSGFSTELYMVDEVGTFGQADMVMSAKIKKEALKRAPGKEQRGLKVTSEKFALEFRHVLVPMWVGVFRHNGERFQYLINGQSSEMWGEKPLSTQKMVATVGGGVGLITILALLFG